MLSKILRAKTTDHYVVVSEQLSSWEIVDPTLTDDDEDLYSLDDEENEVENKGACVSVLLDDVACLLKDEEETKVENKAELLDDVTRLLSNEEDDVELGFLGLVSRNDDVYEEDDDVDDDDDGFEEDLMGWKLKGRFEKQKMGKRGVLKSSLNKMPCYYYTRPKTVLERRSNRLVW